MKLATRIQIQEHGHPELAVIEMRRALARKFAAHTHSEGEHPTAISGLTLSSVIRPRVLATRRPACRAFPYSCRGENLSISEERNTCAMVQPFSSRRLKLPFRARLLKPQLAMRLLLDMTAVQEILSREDLPEAIGSSQRRGLAVGETTVGLLAATSRLLELLDTPEDIPFLALLVQREIAYRILRTPQGERLHAIATRGDLSNRTVRAIAWLRANYTKPLRMEELAGIARMGVSTFHHQFRALTAMSPLQYQKQLRLQAARQQMLADGVDATHAAYEVGYESVSQFSREYSRFFGQPPMRDVRTLRSAGAQERHLEAVQHRANVR